MHASEIRPPQQFPPEIGPPRPLPEMPGQQYDKIPHDDLRMLRELYEKYPAIDPRLPGPKHSEPISRQKLRDVNKMHRRAYDYEHPTEAKFARQHKWTKKWTTAMFMGTATFIAAAILATKLKKQPTWETASLEHFPFEQHPTILMLDSFDGPRMYNILSKHPDITLDTTSSRGLFWSNALHIHCPKTRSAVWKEVTLRWFFRLPLRSTLVFAFQHSQGYGNGPHFMSARARYQLAGHNFDSGFAMDRNIPLWPCTLLAAQPVPRISIQKPWEPFPGYFTTCGWACDQASRTYQGMIINNESLPIAGTPLGDYDPTTLTTGYLQISAWFGYDAADYYLEHVTIASIGPLLPDLEAEHRLRSRLWPLEDIPEDVEYA